MKFTTRNLGVLENYDFFLVIITAWFFKCVLLKSSCSLIRLRFGEMKIFSVFLNYNVFLRTSDEEKLAKEALPYRRLVHINTKCLSGDLQPSSVQYNNEGSTKIGKWRNWIGMILWMTHGQDEQPASQPAHSFCVCECSCV